MLTVLDGADNHFPFCCVSATGKWRWFQAEVVALGEQISPTLKLLE